MGLAPDRKHSTDAVHESPAIFQDVVQKHRDGNDRHNKAQHSREGAGRSRSKVPGRVYQTSPNILQWPCRSGL